ncbi:BTB domain-containing protein [Mycena indigotica]|uniref:BTB domain-containing protein n=1 Tax=Mycena indigotica TaxID=2126181 RepID=A0A8H6SSE2_9AGAR|nr:BTB domain-containing protein [Mycena indigotica]KAF7304027.1 BTB domain-containing protein [Mycena indigotica]
MTSNSEMPTAPFNDSTADTILRSVDGVDFLVHSSLLSLASPVFRTMFSLPQAASEPRDGLKTVQLTEQATEIDDMLRFWYPGAHPHIRSIDHLADIIQLAIGKYDMETLVPMAKVFLAQYLSSDALTVFAVAFRFGWEESVQSAARECLKLPLRSASQSLSKAWIHTSGTAYHALIEYHLRCGDAIRALPQEATSGWILRWPPHFPASCCSLTWTGELCGRAAWLSTFFIQYCDKLSYAPRAGVDASWVMDNLVAPQSGFCHKCRSYPYRAAMDLIDNVWSPLATSKIAEIQLIL